MLTFYSLDDEHFTNNGAIVNDGTIIIAKEAFSEQADIPAEIKDLGFTGDGRLKVTETDENGNTDSTYTNSGEPVLTGPLNLASGSNQQEDGFTWDGKR